MPRLIAFLRAVNVGGRNVTMEELRAHFSALGFTDVDTFIASGNVLFTSRGEKIPVLKQKIEARLRSALGYDVAVFIRTVAEVAAIAAYKAFNDGQVRTAGALSVGFLEAPLEASTVERLRAFKTDIDEFHVHDREVFWRCKTRQSESTMSNAVFERLLNVRVTFRGINTISRLSVKFCGVVPPRENIGHSSPKGGVAPPSARGPKAKRDR